MTSIVDFLNKINASHESVFFSETIAVIDENYEFVPTQFKNGELLNDAGKNSGSCKLFAFAGHQGLSKSETLICFGEHYRDVMQNPAGTDHQNIRNFIKTGWEGVSFEGKPLTPKV